MINKEKDYLDRILTGFFIAVLSPFIGFIIVSMFYSMNYNMEVYHFINSYFINTEDFQSSIISLSLIINLLPFYVFYQSKKDNAVKGVILGTLAFFPLITYLKYLR